MEISPEDVGKVIGGAIVAVPAVWAFIRVKGESATKIWKDLYEAKDAESKENDVRMSRLEAKVEILESNFVKQVAEGVASAISKFLQEQDPHH